MIIKVFWVNGDEWNHQRFYSYREAMLFAHHKVRGGFSSDEVELQDEDGSLNVRLPLLDDELAWLTGEKRLTVNNS